MGTAEVARENGKKGGRPKGSVGKSTLQAEVFRQALVDAVLKEKEPIIQALVKKAKMGDVLAAKELFERVLGKVSQPVAFDKDTLKVIQATIVKIATEK